MKIQGEIGGLKKSVLDRLEAIYEAQVPPGRIITDALACEMLELTAKINREIAIYINRRGKVVQVAVGDAKTASLPEIEGRKSALRLSGIRCVHTHPNGDSSLSGPDIASLKSMRFDVMAAVAGDAGSQNASIAFLSGEYDAEDNLVVEGIGPAPLEQINQVNLAYLTAVVDKELARRGTSATAVDKERAVLVGLEFSGAANSWSIDDSLEELKQLAETAGAEVAGRVTQKRDRPDSALFIGRGKLEELALLLQTEGAHMAIFDDELSPSQQRNIERLLGVKILDRTSLILDIFAQRARSHEGKLQVELAQLRYHLPRIGGQGLVLSRLGGGIGARGPGETKLEVDKRRIRGRIGDIEKQIDLIKKHRLLHRENRASSNLPTAALVGYTNAGKSTLLNALTAADVLAEDKLFATLDPTTRKVKLKSGREILLTDTVGFIQKLPHSLVLAFRATLEEVKAADLLLHVIDGSHANYEEQMTAVHAVLKELGAEDKPVIYVFNKIDKVVSEGALQKMLRLNGSIGISAKKEIGLEALKDEIETFFAGMNLEVELLVPYGDSAMVAMLHNEAVVRSVAYEEGGTRVLASIQLGDLDKFNSYIVGE